MEPIKITICTIAPNGRPIVITSEAAETYKTEAVSAWEFDLSGEVLTEHELRAAANATAAGLYAPDGSYDADALYAHKGLTLAGLLVKNWTDVRAKSTPFVVMRRLGYLLIKGDTITEEAIAALKK